MSVFSQYLPDEFSLLSFGKKIALAIGKISTINALTLYFNGELGAGKTTLSRSIIQAFGHKGKVKSPTYTLVEEYHLAEKNIYHFDLYRLASGEELEFMGIRDYFTANNLCLIEWAEKGTGYLPQADLLVNLDYAKQGRNIELVAQTEIGNQLIQHLTEITLQQ